MKKLLTLVAAALMAVGVNAQTEDVIKVSSGNSNWGQMFVDDGVAFEWPGRTFESTDKLTAKALYAGSNLKDSEDKDLTYARESGSVQTYTIEFGATPTVKLQICVNCIIPNQYGGGHSTMRYKPLTIEDNKASFTVSKEDCSYTGLSYKKVMEGEKEKWIQDKEYTDEPQDVTSLVLQACEKDATYPAVINIKSIKRVTTTATDIPQETVTISPSGYSTYAAYYPVNYRTLGLTAYTVKLNGDKTGIVMKEVEGVVPAGVAVLLKGEANKDYALPKDEGGENVTSDLKLSDGNATSTDAATLYALSTVNGVTAFYPVKKNSPISAKRCYLEVVKKDASASNAAFYSLGTNVGETTGISSVENKVEKADAPVYNLAGQLVGKDYKGLVIKNGKKFVIK